MNAAMVDGEAENSYTTDWARQEIKFQRNDSQRPAGKTAWVLGLIKLFPHDQNMNNTDNKKKLEAVF